RAAGANFAVDPKNDAGRHAACGAREPPAFDHAGGESGLCQTVGGAEHGADSPAVLLEGALGIKRDSSFDGGERSWTSGCSHRDGGGPEIRAGTGPCRGGGAACGATQPASAA
ncbi:unnamed protein product, partial [Polarella glacialis]